MTDISWYILRNLKLITVENQNLYRNNVDCKEKVTSKQSEHAEGVKLTEPQHYDLVAVRLLEIIIGKPNGNRIMTPKARFQESFFQHLSRGRKCTLITAL